MLDLDHFKMLNDTFGHAEGDRVLQATATTLSRTVGEAGFVARVGGEEFAIALSGAGEEAAVAVAERCRGALASLASAGTPLACSAGVASYPAHAGGVAQLLHAADGALYWAKRSGRDRVRAFDPRHVVRAVAGRAAPRARGGARRAGRRRAGLPAGDGGRHRPRRGLRGAGALRAALRAPAADAGSSRRTAAGSAPRSRHARSAPRSPCPAARPAPSWRSTSSPAALLSPEVKRALPFDLDGIVIELTEHEAFDEDGALELELAALRERGARIALDDAGAGYAGLQQLVRLRPEIVKVDRSLIAGIHEDASKLALLQALAGFAGTTGAAVCAEGVEELAELRALAGFDVTYAQGYALARPAPAWPAIPAAVAAAAASADDHGMRLAGAADTGAAPSLGDLADLLARAETIRELNLALGGVTLLLGAEEAAISRLDPVAGCLITVSDHDGRTRASAGRWRTSRPPRTWSPTR